MSQFVCVTLASERASSRRQETARRREKQKLEYGARWRANNKERIREYQKNKLKEDPEFRQRRKQYKSRESEMLTDSFVAARLGMTLSSAPPELIQLKRASILVNREIAKHRKRK